MPLYLARGVLWQIRTRLRHSFIATLAKGARVRVHPTSAYSPIFYCRSLERKDLQIIERHASLADTFVDAGANVGRCSAALFGRFRRFVLFEPTPGSCAALCESLALNTVVSRPVNMGLGDAQGALHFLDEGQYFTTSRFVIDPPPRLQTIQVPCGTLDNELSAEPGQFVAHLVRARCCARA